MNRLHKINNILKYNKFLCPSFNSPSIINQKNEKFMFFMYHLSLSLGKLLINLIIPLQYIVSLSWFLVYLAYIN